MIAGPLELSTPLSRALRVLWGAQRRVVLLPHPLSQPPRALDPARTDQPEEWACPRCTLLNADHVAVCAACTHPRPAAPPADDPFAAAALPGCSRCHGVLRPLRAVRPAADTGQPPDALPPLALQWHVVDGWFPGAPSLPRPICAACVPGDVAKWHACCVEAAREDGAAAAPEKDEPELLAVGGAGHKQLKVEHGTALGRPQGRRALEDLPSPAIERLSQAAAKAFGGPRARTAKAATEVDLIDLTELSD